MKFRMPQLDMKNPGPWRAEKHAKCEIWYVLDADGREVCVVYYKGEHIAARIAANGPGAGECIPQPLQDADASAPSVAVVPRPTIECANVRKIEVPPRKRTLFGTWGIRP